MNWFEIHEARYWIYGPAVDVPAVGEVQWMVPGYVARLIPEGGARRHVYVPPLGTFPTMEEARAAVEQAAG